MTVRDGGGGSGIARAAGTGAVDGSRGGGMTAAAAAGACCTASCAAEARTAVGMAVVGTAVGGKSAALYAVYSASVMMPRLSCSCSFSTCPAKSTWGAVTAGPAIYGWVKRDGDGEGTMGGRAAAQGKRRETSTGSGQDGLGWQCRRGAPQFASAGRRGRETGKTRKAKGKDETEGRNTERKTTKGLEKRKGLAGP